MRWYLVVKLKCNWVIGCIATMTDDDSPPMSPARFFEAMGAASEDVAQAPTNAAEAMFGTRSMGSDVPIDLLSETATFKTRVQSSGRISIPDTEREALGIENGDLVQAVIVPLTGATDSND